MGTNLRKKDIIKETGPYLINSEGYKARHLPAAAVLFSKRSKSARLPSRFKLAKIQKFSNAKRSMKEISQNKDFFKQSIV